ncbi:MAG TPA: saccharopine dehydrogenase [Desulfobacteraceae bacterium]|nr:saccharopine dehydrogenase [Desulfobacteraceae bacterium]
MKIAVLGGLGLQGKAALLDLVKSESVREIVCADVSIKEQEKLAKIMDTRKIKHVRLDASYKADLSAFFVREKVDAAIDLLPLPFMENVFESAVETGISVVSTNYGKPIRHLHAAAVDAGVVLMPECGLDPGIDLVICGNAARRFDELHVFNSYCGGIPEKSACDNPLNYKISWNWEMVLRTQQRTSVFIKDGRRVEVPPAEQHENDMIHTISFPGLGELEAIPNGDAAFYTDLLGVTASVKQAGRYALRWPGWCQFWRPVKKLGFLSDETVQGLPCPLTPHEFLVKFLEPKLQYRDGEKDLVVMYNVFGGIIGGSEKTMITTLTIERDPDSGLFGMSLGVGIPGSIVAQMIAGGVIASKGILNPSVDIPYNMFMSALQERGIQVKEEMS